jgi:hypothetical protein
MGEVISINVIWMDCSLCGSPIPRPSAAYRGPAGAVYAVGGTQRSALR